MGEKPQMCESGNVSKSVFEVLGTYTCWQFDPDFTWQTPELYICIVADVYGYGEGLYRELGL